jgi:uncharacterized membrane protein
MRILGLIAATSTLLAACGSREAGPAAAPAHGNEAAARPPAQAPAGPADAKAASWDLQLSGDGIALILAGADRPALRLVCPAGGESLLVNVPGFRPVGSEERLSFGSGGHLTALVADTSGDRRRGGVSATGAVPDDLAALVAGPVSASYGAQRSGPHPAPPAALAGAFVAACRQAAPPPAETASAPATPASPCLVQDGKALAVAPVRALGTEPFWNARVEGRCVTYSSPDEPKGTRVWARFTPAPGGGTWSGSLSGRRFELEVAPKPGCSDGMSDKSYPLAAELHVGGKRLKGCAEPL